MVFFLIIIVVVCSIAAIIKFALGEDNTSQPVNANSLTEEQKQWLQKVGNIFRENKALTFLDVYVECGMPKEIAYSKDINAIKQAFPFNKEETKHDGYDVFTSYQWAIAERYNLQHDKLQTIDAAQYGLHLQKEEFVYHRINCVTLHQEKTTRYNITYSGVRWQSGIMRAGNMFITNQRILFVGKQKNITKSIPVKSVLYYNLYQDGILVNVPNRKPILFKFEIGYNANLISVEDGLNEFVIVLNRIISSTETQNLLK